MKIASDFKDYYECMQGAFGHQPEPLYMRYRLKKQYEYEKYPFARGLNIHLGGYHTDFTTIGFCGKVYYCTRIFAASDYYKREPLCFIYSFDQLEHFVQKCSQEHQRVFYSSGKFKYAKSPAAQLKIDFKKLELRATKDAQFFNGQLFPIFVGHYDSNIFNKKHEVVINGQLSPYNFAKVMPPQQAFQELQMYLSNLAFPNKPIPVVSNNDMIEAKGFNLKTSFRKAKS